jgi:hypothetical protein
LLREMGTEPGELAAVRQPYRWRKRYLRLVARVERLTSIHYRNVRERLDRT